MRFPIAPKPPSTTASLIESTNEMIRFRKTNDNLVAMEDIMTSSKRTGAKFYQPLLSLSAIALLGLASATSFAHAENVRIGVFGPFTGDAAGMGNSFREVIDLAIDEKNSNGGVLNRKIEVIFCDDAGRPEQAVSCAQRLTTRDNVSVMLGSISSPASLAASQVALQRQTPQIVISGTAQVITRQGNPWVFRSAVPDTGLASDLADFIAEKFPEVKRIGAIFVNDDFGRGGLEAFRNRASEIGISMVTEEAYTRGDLDFTAQLSRIRNAEPDAILDWSRYTESSLIAKQIESMDMQYPIFASDGTSHPRFRELAGESADGWFYATHFSTATASDIAPAEELIDRIKAAYSKEPDFVHAQAFDAITAALMAIEAAGSSERDAIRDALRDVDFDGVRGRFSFDEYGDPSFRAHIVVVRDGMEENARLIGN